MRAAQVSKLEGPESIEVVDIPEPAEFPGGVVIDVHAAGVAFPDVLMTRGLYQMKPELPFVVGGEVAGIVRSAPEDARVKAGDRVVALTMLGNAVAETAVTAKEMVFRLPDNISLEAGAGILFNDLTVHFCLRNRGRLAEGETVLVHGAAGGIGTSTLRMAEALGASRVIAVVSTEEKAEVARANGASDVVLTDGWLAAVKELTGGRGVDIVLDPVGGDRFTDSIRSLAPAGRLLVVGFTAGEIPTVKVNRLLLKNVEVVGAAWGEWVMTHPGYLQEQWDEVAPLLESGKIAAPQPVLYPLTETAAAVAALDNRSAKGKVVVTVR
ncbi:NADPH:quinone oxidoreductase [Nocardia sp. 852002-20019_SCH5090214]|jgi:NADPH2:quinone reductase|uniref:NADPH:quinone oxidoreductase family protein n=1 Tax=Nocardia nova TaxID=37330 RepID=A0A2S5ZX81_9NOCA|nr:MULTISPECIES: NADPH:quinone oxidoreductase family protein [Nocardia]OBF86640.1 NADPH:quinone oxidoreductase [Mycobacterium sp. 852002-51759_SCH5129042]MBF6145742.1 NADPH:quinone oxidoreductase family protein [Nocardia nova]MBF6274756.1 NADPH:quinone oxidoreductase family protein [Nocardia nova]MBV7706556.1 NADPH:quinone oxidoreductase family protein [Nocardia nova]MDN2499474.1 NADPH:quinone oxidoreductase family protein [Nocardia nova]